MISDKQLSLTTSFGLKGGRIVVPGEVKSGLACGCTCPGCGAFLIAKKGSTNAWHFAHHNVAGTLSCLETAIHAAAKQILLDENWLQVPEKRIYVTGQTKSGASLVKSEVLTPSRAIRFDHSLEEVWETNLRPDVVGYRGDRRILVEMFFTHDVDEAKRDKLDALRLPALEIDLSTLARDAGFDAVRQRVLHDVAEKEWLFYPGEQEATAALRSRLDAQISLINLEHDRKLEAKQRYEESKRRQAERANKAHVDANEKYRALPQVEKERHLRKSLGITGAWPQHLNVASSEASAIRDFPKIWQAAVFSRFIFGKKKARVPLRVHTVRDWVVGRFGGDGGRAPDVLAAVVKFLAHLRTCGFLEKSAYNPYETEYYQVVHDKLEPPGRVLNTVVPVALPRAALATRAIEPYWFWSDKWQRRAAILDAASALLVASPYACLLFVEVEKLSPLLNEENPLDLALRLEKQGVPKSVTLDFLVKIGLVGLLPRTGCP